MGSMVMSQLRVYPMEFVEQLFKVFMADGARELRGGQHLVIPPSWETAVREFDEQLDAWAS